MNWEEEYHRLKHERDHVLIPLLLSALKQLPQDDVTTSHPTSHPYSDTIAPRDSGWPLILRMATPDERKHLAESARKKIRNGKWIGAESGSAGHRRPQVGMATKRAREEQHSGLRPSHVRKNRKTSVYQPTVPFPATHVILIGAGIFPKEEGDVASHICHVARCVDLHHLVWESSGRNNRRESLCNKRKECRCGLEPPCNFTLH